MASEKKSTPGGKKGADEDRPRNVHAEPRGNGGPRVVVHAERRLCRTCLRLLLSALYDRFDVIEADSLADVARLASADPAVRLAVVSSICADDVELGEVGALVTALRHTPVVLHTDTDDPGFVTEAIGVGLKGVLPATVSGETAVEALRLVLAGEMYLPAMLLDGRRRPGARRDGRRTAGGRPLTEREITVLELLGRSLSNREIAQRLGIAEGTVKIHVRNIMKKTGVRKRVRLALLAAESAAPRDGRSA